MAYAAREAAVPPAPATAARWLPADPAPLGLAAFALTTFVLSLDNAGIGAATVWLGLALFYGGFVQLLAGMWEFANRNTFGATAFSSYGGFWLALGIYVVLVLAGKVPAPDLTHQLGWFLVAFAIFNTYMLMWSTMVSAAVFAVFLTLELTEIILFAGNFAGSTTWVHIGGYLGFATAAAAWYASAAGVINAMSARAVLPVGRPFYTWSGPMRPGPMPRAESPAAETAGTRAAYEPDDRLR